MSISRVKTFTFIFVFCADKYKANRQETGVLTGSFSGICIIAFFGNIDTESDPDILWENKFVHKMELRPVSIISLHEYIIVGAD